MQYHYFQIYTIITCYTYYAIKIRGYRSVPHLCFCKVLVNSLQSGKAFPHKLCSFISSLSACHASSASIAGVTNLLEAESYFSRAD